ncbi:putative ATP-dependent DNA helicase HFM1 [Trichonephila clavipes]|nr:putative ATP-dependent DNA helicase HFM1 [Trichonephila clavipes]
MVLIKDDSLLVNKWSLGRITKLVPGTDGKVRVVEIKTNKGNIKRSIGKRIQTKQAPVATPTMCLNEEIVQPVSQTEMVKSCCDASFGLDCHKSFAIQYETPNTHSGAKDNKLKDFPKHNPVENMESKMRSCYHKCLNKAICAHFCCKTGIQVSAAQCKRTQIENFMDQLQSKMNVFPSKKVKLEGTRKGTATPHPSSKWNDPHFVDEEWFQDINEDLFMEQEPTEKEVKSEVFSFDINLDTAMEKDELQDIETNAKEDKDKIDAPAKSISNSPPTIQQEVWPKEKWNDPVAMGDLFEFSINFLSGNALK